MKKSIIINFFGGPGIGKSTLAAGLFYFLKKRHYDVELLREFAKDRAIEKNYFSMDIQPYITGNQIYSQDLASANFDIVITDSPIILGIMYNKERDAITKNAYNQFLIDKHRTAKNLSYMIQRDDLPFSDNGRRHDHAESISIDKKIVQTLELHNIPFTYINHDEAWFERIEKEINLFK